MIVGQIQPDAKPVVIGWVVLPELGVAGLVQFLVDTGADRTTLHPGDADFLGIDFGKLSGGESVDGIGGSVQMFSEAGELLFWDEDAAEWRVYPLEIDISERTEVNAEYPSLLGRDVLALWAMEYIPGDGVLRFGIR